MRLALTRQKGNLVKFANIVLENTDRAVRNPAMFCRSSAPVAFDSAEGEWLLYSRGFYDFTTYFNALSVGKLKKYASAKSFSLHIELKGSKCIVRQMKATSFSMESEVVGGTDIEIPASSEWISVDVDLIVDSDAVLMSFAVEADGPVYIRNGSYSLEVDHPLNEVNLALATTTFKKESYIEANIASIKKDILGSDDEISKHFHMHVVDNGRTLDCSKLNSDGVTVYPNDNVGGAGGFARGMIQAMEQEVPATHVLLMDDDVAVSPESIKRTYNLLRIANEEHKDAFVSGAMLDYRIVEDQWEDTAAFLDACCQSIKPRLRLTEIADLVFNEDSVPTERQLSRRYAAWWYCCIPVETIKKNGLPLPYFVRYDDVEYGIRCKPKHFMTMNGIGIWHMAFHVRYNPAVERYQTVRNGFIANATTGISSDKELLAYMHDAIRTELKKYGYQNAELILDGFEDFLKGPSFIKGKVAEECFMGANRRNEKMLPFDELQKDPVLKDIDLWSLTRQKINANYPRALGERLVDFVSWNGQKAPLFKDKGGVAIISAAGGIYPAGKIHNHGTILVVDWYNKKGAVRHRDVARYKEISKRYKRDLKFFKANTKRLHGEYAAARPGMTSVEYWKQYLGI